MSSRSVFVEKRPKSGQIGLLSGLFLSLLLSNCGKEKFPVVIAEQPTPTTLDLAAVSFFDEKTGHAVGGLTWERGEILSTDDGGEHWRLDTVVPQKLWGVTFDPLGTAYTVGVGGRLFLKRAGEAAWSLARQDWFFSRNCSFMDERHGLVASGEGFVNGRIQRVGPDFVWEQAALDTFPQEVEAVQWLDTKTAVACGYGLLVRSADGGLSWERLPAGGEFFTALHFPTATVGYVVGKFGTVLKSVDSGKTWQQTRSGGRAGKGAANFNAVFFQSENIGWAAGDDGLLMRTTDGGDHWIEADSTPGGVDFTGISIKNKSGWLSATGGRIFRFEAD